MEPEKTYLTNLSKASAKLGIILSLLAIAYLLIAFVFFGCLALALGKMVETNTSIHPVWFMASVALAAPFFLSFIIFCRISKKMADAQPIFRSEAFIYTTLAMVGVIFFGFGLFTGTLDSLRVLILVLSALAFFALWGNRSK